MLEEVPGVSGTDRPESAAPIASTNAPLLLVYASRKRCLILAKASSMGFYGPENRRAGTRAHNASAPVHFPCNVLFLLLATARHEVFLVSGVFVHAFAAIELVALPIRQ